MLEAPARTVGGSIPTRALPALASLGLRARLGREPRPATVLGASRRFAWCALEDAVVVLASPDAARFPNAILTSGFRASLEVGAEVLIGSNAVVGHGIDWRVVRWWDPSVTPIHVDRRVVEARVSAIAQRVTPLQLDLEAALTGRDPVAVIDAAAEMLGNGAGLTPRGDDRLLGACAAFRHVTASLGHPQASELIDGVADEMLAIAATKTTLLSRTLLRHALAGEVPDPVAGVLRSLTGHGSTSAALERCLAIGASSGLAFVHGMVCGARAGWDVAS